MTTTTTTSVQSDLAERLRPLARQWVSQTFFGNLLRQARDNPLIDKNNPLNGGRGGAVFQSLLDQQFAQCASKGVGGKLVDAIVDDITGVQGTPDRGQGTGGRA